MSGVYSTQEYPNNRRRRNHLSCTIFQNTLYILFYQMFRKQEVKLVATRKTLFQSSVKYSKHFTDFGIIDNCLNIILIRNLG